jgi:hypothetical protein
LSFARPAFRQIGTEHGFTGFGPTAARFSSAPFARAIQERTVAAQATGHLSFIGARIFHDIFHPAFEHIADPGKDIGVDLFYLIMIPLVHYFKSGVDPAGKIISGHSPAVQLFFQLELDPPVSFPLQYGIRLTHFSITSK